MRADLQSVWNQPLNFIRACFAVRHGENRVGANFFNILDIGKNSFTLRGNAPECRKLVCLFYNLNVVRLLNRPLPLIAFFFASELAVEIGSFHVEPFDDPACFRLRSRSDHADRLKKFFF
ncbi:hypothetical protein SDC9_144783 [bioreactor metagenome]|uniref:Uncharacterized protein n=1 Tax=bioreactor metagenome TaxID=1076179 RepID=A0A645E8Q8_9ZZZZ